MSELHPLQRFEIEDLHRSEMKNATYNPRTITPERRAKLRQSLSEFGSVQTPIWNKRTGNLVGGHKRLGELDELSETGPDYFLTVAVVDLDEEREKALNVILNSTEVGGEFDGDMLSRLLGELHGKLTFDLDSLISGQKKKTGAKLKKLNVQSPPKMAWVLVGIPLIRFHEINAQVEQLARVPDTIVETTMNNADYQNRQPQPGSET